jgi:hypothetical protein
MAEMNLDMGPELQANTGYNVTLTTKTGLAVTRTAQYPTNSHEEAFLQPRGVFA